MGFVANKVNQVTLGDRYSILTDREKKALDESWAKLFAETIFPAIREERFAPLYSSNPATRPNTPVNVIVGGMIIKEFQDLTDDELREGLMFDIRLQYALHTTSHEEQPMSDRTLSRFRLKLYEYEQETGKDLMKEEIVHLSSRIAKLMKLKPKMKRMDSLMIASACKDMTRLEVVYVTVSNLVKAVHGALGDELLVGMERYLREDDRNRVIYHNRAEERLAKIQNIIEDGAALLERLGAAGSDLPEYLLVSRLLEDQSHMDENGNPKARDNRDISPSSLQNPSDPDATYRRKREEHHTGYVANVVETFDEDGNSVITDYSFKQNSHSDSEFCKEAIETIAASSEGTEGEPTILIGDGLFASRENSRLAQEGNIKLVTTAMTGPKPPEAVAGFEIDKEKGQVLNCPAGNVPIRQSRNPVTGNYRIVMEKSECRDCPHRRDCNAKMQAKSAVVNVTEGKVERARVANNGSVTEEEYAKYRNARNAVEAIPSVLRRKHEVDNMPVFGSMKSKLFFGLKIAAINIQKLVKFAKNKLADSIQNPNPQAQCVQM